MQSHPAVEFLEVKSSDEQISGNESRVKDPSYPFKLCNGQFTECWFNYYNVSIGKSKLEHTDVIGILWINSLKQLVTLSLDELKIWQFEKNNFVCVMKQNLGDLKYYQNHIYDYDEDHEPRYIERVYSHQLEELQISPDNRLIAARMFTKLKLDDDHVVKKNEIILFDILTRRWMTIDTKWFDLGTKLTVLSSTEIALSQSSSNKISTLSFKINLNRRQYLQVGYFEAFGDSIANYALLPGGKHIVFIGDTDRKVILYDNTSKRYFNLRSDSPSYSTRVSADGTRLIIDRDDSKLIYKIHNSPIEAEKEELFHYLLAICLPKFSNDLIKQIASYCHPIEYTFDARIQTPRLSLYLCCEIQLYILELMDYLKQHYDKRKRTKLNAMILACFGNESVADIRKSLNPLAEAGVFSHRTKMFLKQIEDRTSQKNQRPW